MDLPQLGLHQVKISRIHKFLDWIGFGQKKRTHIQLCEHFSAKRVLLDVVPNDFGRYFYTLSLRISQIALRVRRCVQESTLDFLQTNAWLASTHTLTHSSRITCKLSADLTAIWHRRARAGNEIRPSIVVGGTCFVANWRRGCSRVAAADVEFMTIFHIRSHVCNLSIVTSLATPGRS